MSKKKGRSASSSRWLDEHERDAFVQASRDAGYRSRAVYKLQEIDQRDKLLKKGQTVVDLGAAPGGWCQYVQQRVGSSGQVYALDILGMDSVPGVEVIQGDFRENEVLQLLEDSLAGRPVDLVLSDMAPNISGIRVADQAAAMGLAELALEFAREHLRSGGDFLVKVFQGEGIDDFRREIQELFEKLVTRKPDASRDRSREVYLLGRHFRG